MRLEGIESIEAAVDRDARLALVLAHEGDRSPEAQRLLDRLIARGVPILEEGPREMRRMSGSEAPPELLALEGPSVPIDLAGLMRAEGPVFLLAGLRYPSNVGYILRCAEVAGAAGVVISGDWQGSQREEASRLGMRADRFLAVLEEPATRALGEARRAGRRTIALETGGGRAPWDVDLAHPTVFVVGGETTGIEPGILEVVDEVVSIPMNGFIPSYNVQGAVGILIGEWLRQRSAR